MTKEELYIAIREQGPEMDIGARAAAYMQGEEVDCLPYSLLSHEALANYWGFTQSELRQSPDALTKVLERKEKEYGESGISVSLGLHGLGKALGSQYKDPENDEVMVTKPVLTDYALLDQLKDFDVSKNDFLMSQLENLTITMEKLPHMPVFNGVAGPMSAAVSLRPVELLLRDMIKNPDEFHRLLDFCVQCNLKWIQKVYDDFGVSVVSIADPATSTDLLGYRYFKKFSYPHIKDLFDGIVRITGLKPSLHICGHSKAILKDLADIGFDNFSLDNCEDLEEIKQLVGDRMVLGGNVAPVDIMLNGSIDDVIESVKKCIYQGSDNPCGFIVMPGCQVPLDTPKENIDAFRYAVREYSKHARKGVHINPYI